MSEPSIVDRPVQLSELFEPTLFTELVAAFVEEHHVGVKIYDGHHHQLVDVASTGAPLIDWLFEHPAPKRAITRFISSLKALDVEPEARVQLDDPVAGTRYLALPITYEFEVIGKLVVGPYLPPAALFAPRTPATADLDRERFSALRDQVPAFADADLERRVRLLLSSVDCVCHAGYQQLLTSNMHLESITQAYEELREANAQLADRNARLAAHNDELRALDQIKSDFLATVSHELRTPLTSVIGYTEMLVEGLAGPVNPEQRDYLQTIMERSESLLQQISGLLDMAKIEQAASSTELGAEMELAVLLKPALDSVRPQAIKRGLTLDVEVDEDLPLMVVDADKVRQILTNLLGNAVKFTARGGRVTLRVIAIPARDKRTWVRFAVIDTGIGVPEDQLDRIFEAFYQVDGSSTREYGGSGLGLAIVRSFVESHGGVVRVESEPGEGSTFSFDLPVRGADSA